MRAKKVIYYLSNYLPKITRVNYMARDTYTRKNIIIYGKKIIDTNRGRYFRRNGGETMVS